MNASCVLTDEEYRRLTRVLDTELMLILDKVIEVSYQHGYLKALDYTKQLIEEGGNV